MQKKFLFALFLFLVGTPAYAQQPPIYIAFLWHMHQPIYYPYESPVVIDANHRFSYSVVDVHNQRRGPYTHWPADAVNKGISAGLSHLGAQVSFSGSLMENLNALEGAGNSNFQSWKSSWSDIRTKTTALGNPRLDMVGFGYYHPLMGLIPTEDISMQIARHRSALNDAFGSSTASKGIFPPENAFSERMIPALAQQGIQWALVDNIHFERACTGYPYSTGGNLYEPNKADQQNPDPHDWIQLSNVWAGTKVSARWAHQPHYIEYIDPATGASSKMIAVPTDRYLGNEDGRGGFGALQYESVMSQFESSNTDPAHPILIVLHHDGDNYGGGTDSYYGSNFQNFVTWLQENSPRFVCTTVQDYLAMFPPNMSDVIHVEDGSWSGADNGDPQFLKWLGKPGSNGYSPDYNSWSVITAAQNVVHTADKINASHPAMADAWKFLLAGEASDYWYWDGTEIWDSNPTRAANEAVTRASAVTGTDATPPTIFLPQRVPYNPGATEWGIGTTNALTVWSFIYDLSGIKSTAFKYRFNTTPVLTAASGKFDGSAGVSPWFSLSMRDSIIQPQTNPLPLRNSKLYTATVTGLKDTLVDYCIEAMDSLGNIGRSPIMHCWIGANQMNPDSGTGSVYWLPASPTKNDTITIFAPRAGFLHWGVNNSGSSWIMPPQTYWPQGSQLFGGTGPAIQSPMVPSDSSGAVKIQIGPFNQPEAPVARIAFVLHYSDDTWDNNGSQDFHIDFGDTLPSSPFTMDGNLDASAQKIAGADGIDLYVAKSPTELYVATQSAHTQGGDVFLFVTDSLRTPIAAPWAKSGTSVAPLWFLADESANTYCAWTVVTGSNPGLLKATGTFLEGIIPLASATQKYYLAAGKYETNDGGRLVAQVPSGNGDGNIDAAEFVASDAPALRVAQQIVLPSELRLMQNYPNPFNPSTTICWNVPRQVRVRIQIFDILGRQVASIADQTMTPGSYSTVWQIDGNPSGMYFCRMQAGGYSSTIKLVAGK